MKFVDYLSLRTPPSRMGAEEEPLPPGKVPTSRVILSLVGMLLGIIASFFVIGLVQEKASNVDATQQTSAAQAGQSSAPVPSDVGKHLTPFTWQRFWIISLISLVVCGLSYQGLYFSLRLYEGQPAFLILFVAFQYGYFWQSAVNGANVLLSKR